MGDWTKCAFALVALNLVACGGDDAPDGKPKQSSSGGGGGSSGSGGSGGTDMPMGGAPPQDSECGLANTAFCATFEQGPSPQRGRAGDLDPLLFSAGRVAPQNMSGGEKVVWVGPATIPTSCRDGVGPTVYPPDDTLICDPTAAIGSSHLLTAVASQNYGLNSYRIRQPFDFEGRTGTIAVDVDATMLDGLWGWASIEITEDGSPTPSFTNYEYGPLPANALAIHFDFDQCADGEAAVGHALLFQDHEETELDNTLGGSGCFATQEGHLNRVRVRVSETRVEVLAGDFSADGLAFPEPRVVFAADVDLPFSRGYVHVTAHNHATLKYGGDDAWIVRWDNIGFDGPKITNYREYEIPDSLRPAAGDEMDGMNLGYKLGDDPAPTPPLTFENVDLENVTSAALSLSSYYLNQGGGYDDYTLRFRFNGGAFVDRPLNAGEVTAISTMSQLGAMVQTIEVPLSALQNGTNTLEFATSNVPTNYPPAVANIDLILTTE